ncbi:DUF3644 domain-containing protein [Rhodococcoides fascians]|uniref:DUF3644 domain-containing protein n=1 Tax=Rhodococcoides fascians TaxID=1828 RepID=UPI001F5EB795|nr:DUF3644 domain-containing protein [Rhodococcus fascians]
MTGLSRWSATLAVARQEAVLAMRLYNDSNQPRSFEGFVVHMHLAWLYLLHAQFTKAGIDFRYRDRSKPHRFVTIDGEHKRWDLGRSVETRWPDTDNPVRKNVEFFILLRNRIEHRYSATDSTLALSLAGHAQANLVNFEKELHEHFGTKHSLASELRFPLFVGSFTTDGAETLIRLRNKLPVDLRRMIADFHDGLTEDLANDSRFELRLRVVLEQVQRDPEALAIQFTRWDDMTDVDRKLVAELGRRGQAIVREQKRSVVGHGLLRPQEIERKVEAAIPFTFNSNHFLRARQLKDIRPVTGSKHPERTDERYCIYDEFSQSYGYTTAWAAYLIKKCGTEAGFVQATGRKPRTKTEFTDEI